MLEASIHDDGPRAWKLALQVVLGRGMTKVGCGVDDILFDLGP